MLRSLRSFSDVANRNSIFQNEVSTHSHSVTEIDRKRCAILWLNPPVIHNWYRGIVFFCNLRFDNNFFDLYSQSLRIVETGYKELPNENVQEKIWPRFDYRKHSSRLAVVKLKPSKSINNKSSSTEWSLVGLLSLLFYLSVSDQWRRKSQRLDANETSQVSHTTIFTYYMILLRPVIASR